MAKDDVVLDATYVDIGGKAVKAGSAEHRKATGVGRVGPARKIGSKGQTVSAATAAKYGLGPKAGGDKAVSPGDDK